MALGLFWVLWVFSGSVSFWVAHFSLALWDFGIRAHWSGLWGLLGVAIGQLVLSAGMLSDSQGCEAYY